jgi:hypothetical protein
MSWSRSFDDPIPTPRGKPLVTLRDAARQALLKGRGRDHWNDHRRNP